MSPYVYAIETGLSSDPEMNWRLSALDSVTLISNSDAHSPNRLGREANAFDCELNYREVIETLRKKDQGDSSSPSSSFQKRESIITTVIANVT